MNKIVFDVETTGLDVNSDRIVQIAICIVNDKTEKIEKLEAMLINPEMPIPKEAYEVHGISDAKVRTAKTFRDIAKTYKEYFENNIIVGYNILKYDLPLLYNEFKRVGVNVKFNDKIIDCYKIESHLAPRTLSSTYKKYTGKELEGAHDAMTDVLGTVEILKHQLKVPQIKSENVYELSGSTNIVDFSGKIIKDNKGELIFNFGKHKGKRLKDERDYCNWILKSDFPNDLKDIIKQL